MCGERNEGTRRGQEEGESEGKGWLERGLGGEGGQLHGIEPIAEQ